MPTNSQNFSAWVVSPRQFQYACALESCFMSSAWNADLIPNTNCPTLNTMISVLDTLKPIEQTKYQGCTLPEGYCPGYGATLL